MALFEDAKNPPDQQHVFEKASFIFCTFISGSGEHAINCTGQSAERAKQAIFGIASGNGVGGKAPRVSPLSKQADEIDLTTRLDEALFNALTKEQLELIYLNHWANFLAISENKASFDQFVEERKEFMVLLGEEQK
jgi:hypothetical protein